MAKRFKQKKVVPAVILYLLIFSLVLGLSSVDNFYVSSKDYDQLAPRTPQDLSIKVGAHSAEVFWSKNNEADLFNYALYLRTGEEKENIDPILVGETNYHKIEDLNENTTYYLSIAARDRNGNESKPTPEIGFTPDGSMGQDLKVNAWIQASADLESARRSFTENADIFSSISPFQYSAQENGSIEKRGAIVNDSVLNAATTQSVKIIPSITNNFDKDSKLSNLLKNDDVTYQHIEIITQEVINNNYDGIDIDYENLDPKVKDKFTAFVEKLAERLHQQGKILSVTIQAKQSDTQSWSGTGALDLTRLGRAVDQLRIMTYDFSRVNTKPGPIAPVYWMREVVEYAKSKVAKEKIMVGIPFYGYLWCTSGKDNCKNKGLTWEGVNNLKAKYEPIVEWNKVAETPWFLFVDEQDNTKVVNYENHKSLAAKLDAVRELDVAGIAIWRLGSEDPENFPTIKEKLEKKIKSPRSLQATPQNNSIKLIWDKSSDPNIKGYRVYIRQKSLLDKQESADLPANTSGNQVSGNQTSTSLWQERHIDVFDTNEYLLTDIKNDKPYYLSVTPLTWSIDDSEAFLTDEEKQDRISKPIIATPSDLYYPGKIEDLKIEDTGTDSIDLGWQAPGDEFFTGQATKYDLRFSDQEITPETFANATRVENIPQPDKPKTPQKLKITGLEPGVKYFFGIKAEDEAGNSSDLSNIVSTETIDNIPPQVPTVPEISALNGELFVRWEAGTEKDLTGYKLFYKKENSYYNVVDLDRDETSYTLRNLDNNYNYYVSLSAIDSHGNESARGEDSVGFPHKQKSIGRMKGFMNRSSEKIKATVAVFSNKLFNDKAIPFIVVLSVIVINFFIFQGLKREIKKRPDRKNNHNTSDTNTKKRSRPDRVIDLKNVRRTLK